MSSQFKNKPETDHDVNKDNKATHMSYIVKLSINQSE